MGVLLSPIQAAKGTFLWAPMPSKNTSDSDLFHSFLDLLCVTHSHSGGYSSEIPQEGRPPLLPSWLPPSARLPGPPLPRRASLWLPGDSAAGTCRTLRHRGWGFHGETWVPRAVQVGMYDREAVPAAQACREGVWEGRGPERRNEEEGGHMLGKGQRVGSPQERGPACAQEGSEGWGEGWTGSVGSPELETRVAAKQGGIPSPTLRPCPAKAGWDLATPQGNEAPRCQTR